ncbi:MAG TPA: ABATE domain-containing protein [Dongiaceae bacterium]|jgi:predicted RNA-binding Zn ribbon-like protein
MSRDPIRAATQFFGGRACLDFANTLDWRLTDEPVELIPDYKTLLSWSERRGTLSKRAVASLRARSERREDEAQAVIDNAYKLRARIWRMADDLRTGQPTDLRAFNRALADLPPQPDLVPNGEAFVFDLDGANLRQPLWPILWSLSALLASSDAMRLGSCQAEGCGWFFVDESPNHSRMWCSSEVCGNRERARRAYAKRRSKAR